MPPKTRQQSRKDLHSHEEEPGESNESSSTVLELGSNGYRFDQETCILESPSKLTYSLTDLDEETREHILETIEYGSQLIVQQCEAKDQYAIFTVAKLELAECSIQTGTHDSQYSLPHCTCEEESPCYHLLWLFDQVAKSTLQDQSRTLTLTQHGYPRELGNPFDKISEFHLGMLADSLHCGVKDVTPDPNPRRVLEIREMLASLTRTPISQYRPDLFDNPTEGTSIIEMGDLECTIFRMLLSNNEFFNYFYSLLDKDELVKNPFRQLKQRAEAALAGLDAYLSNTQQPPPSGLHNVAWCAKHLTLVTEQVSWALENVGENPPSWVYVSATDTLIYVLKSVAQFSKEDNKPSLHRRDRSLYFRLIDEEDKDFVLPILKRIPSVHVKNRIEDLREIRESFKDRGVWVSYDDRFGAYIESVRRSRLATTANPSKRQSQQSQGPDQRAKRQMK